MMHIKLCCSKVGFHDIKVSGILLLLQDNILQSTLSHNTEFCLIVPQLNFYTAEYGKTPSVGDQMSD